MNFASGSCDLASTTRRLSNTELLARQHLATLTRRFACLNSLTQLGPKRIYVLVRTVHTLKHGVKSVHVVWCMNNTTQKKKLPPTSTPTSDVRRSAT